MKSFATTLAAATVSALSATTAFSQTTPAFNQGFQDGVKTELKRQAQEKYNTAKMRFDECNVSNAVTIRYNQDVVPVVNALKTILPNTDVNALTYQTETGPTGNGTGTLIKLSYKKEPKPQETNINDRVSGQNFPRTPTITEPSSSKFYAGSMVNVADKQIVIAVIPTESKNSANIATEIHVHDFTLYGSRRDIAITKGPEQISQLTGAWAARVAPEIALDLAKSIPEKNGGSYYAPRELKDCGAAPTLQAPKF